MPFLHIQTNASLDAAKQAEVIAMASAATAEALGKPETAMCVAIDVKPMYFAGTDAPCAMIKLGSLGMMTEQIAPVAKTLNEKLSAALGVDGQRMYLHFESPPRTHWAKDGTPYA